MKTVNTLCTVLRTCKWSCLLFCQGKIRRELSCGKLDSAGHKASVCLHANGGLYVNDMQTTWQRFLFRV